MGLREFEKKWNDGSLSWNGKKNNPQSYERFKSFIQKAIEAEREKVRKMVEGMMESTQGFNLNEMNRGAQPRTVKSKSIRNETLSELLASLNRNNKE